MPGPGIGPDIKGETDTVSSETVLALGDRKREWKLADRHGRTTSLFQDRAITSIPQLAHKRQNFRKPSVRFCGAYTSL